MSWFHVSDRFHAHRKAHAAGNAAIGAWTMLGSFASDHGQDGYVPERNARAYANTRELRRLIAAELIEQVEGGYVIHDYLDCNPSQIERATQSERKRRWRDARDASRDASRDTPPRRVARRVPAPAPAPRSKSEQAAAAVQTVGPAAAAALDLYITHRLEAEGRSIKSPARYASTIRRSELAEHGAELAAVAVDADPIEVAVAVFEITKSDAIRARIRYENAHENASKSSTNGTQT